MHYDKFNIKKHILISREPEVVVKYLVSLDMKKKKIPNISLNENRYKLIYTICIKLLNQLKEYQISYKLVV